MRAVVFKRVDKVAVVTMAKPRIEEPRDVIVRVTAAGICGSDLHPFHGREKGLDAGTVMGHEFVGQVSVIERAAVPALGACTPHKPTHTHPHTH